MANVKFDGISEDLTAPNTPWIYYGVSACATYTSSAFSPITQGSYAGARAAHMRVLYPELVYGAIASSGMNTQAFFAFKVLRPRVSFSRDPCFHSTVGVHGCNPPGRRSQVFIAPAEPRYDDRHHALATWDKEGR